MLGRMNLYRIISSRFKDHALSGEGAALAGGRWNIKGSPVVYTSTNLEAVTEEARIQLGQVSPKAIGTQLVVRINVPDLVSRELVRASDLPPEWNNDNWKSADAHSPSYTQRLGAEWLRAGKTCLLFVPSGFIKGRINCLINPRHSDFAQIKVEELWTLNVDEKTGQPSTLDVFICHASEDKQPIVEPLAESLKRAGITYWYDKEQIKWGDSLTGKINKALSTCRYVIVVLSRSFIRKQWPQREWQSALSKEIVLGRTFVLPLIVGDEEAKREILEVTTLQNDKTYLEWTGDTKPIVTALLEVMTQIQ